MALAFEDCICVLCDQGEPFAGIEPEPGENARKKGCDYAPLSSKSNQINSKFDEAPAKVVRYSRTFDQDQGPSWRLEELDKHPVNVNVYRVGGSADPDGAMGWTW